MLVHGSPTAARPEPNPFLHFLTSFRTEQNAQRLVLPLARQRPNRFLHLLTHDSSDVSYMLHVRTRVRRCNNVIFGTFTDGRNMKKSA